MIKYNYIEYNRISETNVFSNLFILKAAYTAQGILQIVSKFVSTTFNRRFCNCDFVKYLVSIIFHGKLLHDLFALFALTQFVPISGLHLLLCISIII